VEPYISKLSSRGYTKHTIKCHVQDLPENGADVFHFKYVHKYPISGINWMQFMWVPNWKAGNDPDLPALFEHSSKDIREFKQQIYNNLVKDHKNKEHLSFANIDNFILLPLIGKLFVFNLTVVQMGPGLVYVFLKTHFFTVLFVQYVQAKGKYNN
jgi:cholesterol 7-dehydrogenase